MKLINCNEAIRKFGSVPRAKEIDNKFPHYTKGFAFIVGDTGASGYAETEEEAIEACTIIRKMIGAKTFFLFSTFGHYKADWTFCGALIEE